MSNIFFSKEHAKKYARDVKIGRLRRLYRGIYTDELVTPLSQIVLKHWMSITSHLAPTGILSHHTAQILKPLPYKDLHIVFVTSTYQKDIHLPGLVIKVIKGDPSLHNEQVLPHLARSREARYLLENLTVVRKAEYRGIKTVGLSGVEIYLSRAMRLGGERRLNRIRDEAKVVARDLFFKKEFEILNKIICALLDTHTSHSILKTDIGRSIANRLPYDSERLTLFEALSLFLRQCQFRERDYLFSKISYKNISFYEAYFSNYIEGTEFVIDEAEDIVFKGKVIANRHKDSHDVLAYFNLTNDSTEMDLTPENAHDFLELLQKRHAFIMQERPEKMPGQFKEVENRAGNTLFVSPSEVVGTLKKGFEIYQLLPAGLCRALYMHFLISEVHPFLDGNGRLARIMMNAELSTIGHHKIIIPTVMRDNYLNGLRLASRDQNFFTYCKVMDQAQAYVSSIDWFNYTATRERLESDSADKTADEGLPFFNRVLRHLPLSQFF